MARRGPSPVEALEARQLFAFDVAPVDLVPTTVPSTTTTVQAFSVPTTPVLSVPSAFTLGPVNTTPLTVPVPAFFVFDGAGNRVVTAPGLDISRRTGGVLNSVDASRATGVGFGFDLTAGGGAGTGIDLTTGDVTGLSVDQSTGLVTFTPTTTTSTGLNATLTPENVLFGSELETGAAFFLGSDGSTIPLLLGA